MKLNYRILLIFNKILLYSELHIKKLCYTGEELKVIYKIFVIYYRTSMLVRISIYLNTINHSGFVSGFDQLFRKQFIITFFFVN